MFQDADTYADEWHHEVEAERVPVNQLLTASSHAEAYALVERKSVRSRVEFDEEQVVQGNGYGDDQALPYLFDNLSTRSLRFLKAEYALRRH